MKTHVIIFVLFIFVLGGLVGHLVSPRPVSGEIGAAQVLPLELTIKAGDLPVQMADAI